MQASFTLSQPALVTPIAPRQLTALTRELQRAGHSTDRWISQRREKLGDSLLAEPLTGICEHEELAVARAHGSIEGCRLATRSIARDYDDLGFEIPKAGYVKWPCGRRVDTDHDFDHQRIICSAKQVSDPRSHSIHIIPGGENKRNRNSRH